MAKSNKMKLSSTNFNRIHVVFIYSCNNDNDNNNDNNDSNNNLLRFFPYAILFSQSLINADIFLPLWWGFHPPTFCDFEQQKYQNLVQNKFACPYIAEMFFLLSRQMKVSAYTGVWYKNA